MGGYLLSAFILVLVFLSIACGPKAPLVPIETTRALETQVAKPSKEGWQKKWEETLAEARKEGEVIIYSGVSSEVRAVWTEHFKDKYGIAIDYVATRGAAMLERILSERRANVTLADLYIGGSAGMYTRLKSAEAIEPFEKELFLPEVIGPSSWFNGRLPWQDAEHTIFSFQLSPFYPLIANTNLVRKGEIQSFRDLLNPKWKEKIILNDPTVPGAGQQWFQIYGIMGAGNLGLDYMKDLVKQKPLLIRNSRLMAEWLAKGKYPLAIALVWSNVYRYAIAGAPVAINDLKEPVYLSASGSQVAFSINRPHPAAAKLFANWLLSKEGQLLTAKASEIQSAREDLDYKGAGAELMSYRREEVKYIFMERREGREKRKRTDELAKEIFGPLLK